MDKQSQFKDLLLGLSILMGLYNCNSDKYSNSEVIENNKRHAQGEHQYIEIKNNDLFYNSHEISACYEKRIFLKENKNNFSSKELISIINNNQNNIKHTGKYPGLLFEKKIYDKYKPMYIILKDVNSDSIKDAVLYNINNDKVGFIEGRNDSLFFNDESFKFYFFKPNKENKLKLKNQKKIVNKLNNEINTYEYNLTNIEEDIKEYIDDNFNIRDSFIVNNYRLFLNNLDSLEVKEKERKNRIEKIKNLQNKISNYEIKYSKWEYNIEK